MQISKKSSGDAVELTIEGRLDGYWADHLAAAVDQEIRQGAHHIRVDLSQVAFLSSAGIGVLVRFYNDLKGIRGSFAVSNCSRNVMKVLELSRLKDVLVAKKPLDEVKNSSVVDLTAPTVIKHIERSGVIYELYPLSPDANLECCRLGDPSRLKSCEFTEEHCRTMRFSESSFAIGLGALGEDFEDCCGRFGEFIAAGGVIVYQPTDGTNVPDFMLGGGTSLPEIQVCYGIACHGPNPQPFSSLIRFEAKKGSPAVSLSLLLETCLDLSDCQRIGVVMIAESAGLIGAALRRSPVAGSELDVFGFPRIRDWLSFTVEPAYTKSVILLAGIALRGSADVLVPVIRPFPSVSNLRPPLAGHLHAAAFSYRPVQKGQIELRASIRTLFERQTVEGLLHLLSDSRTISGGGESELVRGACWFGPISKITVEGLHA